jgi:hypothetical protein
MGYGGIFKSVVKIAVTYVGFQLGGPFGAAVASSAFTASTGGSFKEALMSGAASYIGASISQGLNTSIEGAAADAAFGGATPTTYIGGAGDALSYAPLGSGIQSAGQLIGQTISPGDLIPAGFAGAGTELGGSLFGGAITEGLGSAAQELVNTPIDFSTVTDPISGITDALSGVVDPFLTATSDIGSVYAAVNRDLLGNLLPKFTEGFAVTNAGSLLASAVGGIASLTLEQALNAEIPGLDQALIDEAGFNVQGIQFLRQEARNSLSQQAFEGLQGTAINPGLPEDEFNKILAAGVERENVRLGPDITETQFRTVFDDPSLGQNILGEEESLRRQSYGQEVEQAFPGGAFQELDDRIISSIVEERQGPALEKISRFGARGNLNPTGGQTANLFIQEQVPGVRERIGEIGAGVLGGYRGDIGEIRGRAEEQAGGYKLGEGLFDIAPFSEERRGLIEEREGTLGADVRGAIGPDPLFDVSGALRAGGRSQGVVSGRGQNQALLDQIASRELGSLSGRNRRSLGSRGSGAF